MVPALGPATGRWVVAVSAQRVPALATLLVLGVLSLPLVAVVLDGEGTEDWIIPVQLALMAAVGALVGRMMPALAAPDATPRRAVLVGVVAGLTAAAIGLVMFFELLSGLDGG